MKGVNLLLKISELRKRTKKVGVKEPLFTATMRNVSIYFTYFFAYTAISANQVTFIMLIIGFSSAVAFFMNKMLLGVILMQLWYMFDLVDGEIARIKKQSSITGLYYDHLVHYLNHPGFFISISYALYLQSQIVLILIAGVVAAFFDLIDRASEDTYFMVLYKNIVVNKICLKLETLSVNSKINLIIKTIIRMFSFPGVMNVLTISVVVDFVLIMLHIEEMYCLTFFVMAIYGFVLPVYSIVKMYRNVSSFRLDKELEKLINK